MQISIKKHRFRNETNEALQEFSIESIKAIIEGFHRLTGLGVTQEIRIDSGELFLGPEPVLSLEKLKERQEL